MSMKNVDTFIVIQLPVQKKDAFFCWECCTEQWVVLRSSLLAVFIEEIRQYTCQIIACLLYLGEYIGTL